MRSAAKPAPIKEARAPSAPSPLYVRSVSICLHFDLKKR